MYATRRLTLAPATLARQVPRVNRAALRHQSTSSSSGGSAGASHVASGVAGGVLVLAAGYGLYSFSSAGRLHSGINKTAAEANKYYKEATKKFQENTPDSNEAIEYLKKTAYSYAAFIPGGRGYVDTAFKDLDALRENHSDKVDSILKDTWSELQKISKNGLSIETFQQTLAAFENMSKRLASEAGDAFSSIIDNHPGLKEKVGGNFDQLKQLGDRYGPEAKKQVDQVYKEVQDILKNGLSADSVPKIKKLVEEKIAQVQRMGDDAWNNALKQAQPLLDKNPKVKKLIDENKDALKQGNVAELFAKVKDGKLEDLEKYVDQAKEKVKKEGSKLSSGGGFDIGKIFQMVPGGEQVLPQFNKLKQVAEKHAGEGEQLLKETVDEIQKVLAQKSKKAEELLDKAKKDSTS